MGKVWADIVQKQDIVDEAFGLFARKGFTVSSMENIASALGLKKSSLYSRFKSKNEIIVEVLDEQSAFIINDIHKRLKELSSEPLEILLKGVFE
jgi:AcrR family transcriptional regulator